MGCGPA